MVMPTIRQLVLTNITGVALCFSSLAMAEDDAGIPVGPGYLYPSVVVEELYDDNIFLQDSNEKESWITVISPALRYELDGEFRRFVLGMGLSKGIFHSSSDDNYLDAELTALAEFTPGDRTTLSFGAGYFEGHDARGTGDSEGAAALLFPHPDEYHEADVFARLEYGLKEMYAPRVKFEIGHNDIEYENNRARTSDSDLEEDRFLASFAFMVMPNTSLVLDASYSDTDYDTANSDNQKLKLLAGVSWDATSQTTGYAKFGRRKTDFDNGRDEDGSAWELGVEWKPLSYATVKLSSSRDSEDSRGATVGNSSEITTNKASWRHEWRSYLNSTLFYESVDEDFEDIDREDKTVAYGISANYSMRDWLNFSASISREENDSSVTGLDYDDNVFRISVKIGM
jgi:hypothetical protein